jgi:antitoxin ParD1/3/4
MPRSSRPITVTLGDFRKPIERRVKSGAYASASEVLRALVREEAALDDWMRLRVEKAFVDPRPNRPARHVFRRLRAHHAKPVKSSRGGKA